MIPVFVQRAMNALAPGVQLDAVVRFLRWGLPYCPGPLSETGCAICGPRPFIDDRHTTPRPYSTDNNAAFLLVGALVQKAGYSFRLFVQQNEATAVFEKTEVNVCYWKSAPTPAHAITRAAILCLLV